MPKASEGNLDGIFRQSEATEVHNTELNSKISVHIRGEKITL